MAQPQQHMVHGTADGGTEASQYLTFVVGGETYAIGILRIKEILEFGTVTRVPLMPATIRGVINLRGSVVPVIDLASRFGGEPSRTSRRTCIVIVEIQVEDERHVVGVLVDGVNAVLDIQPDDIEPPPSFGATVRTDFIAGMARLEDRFIILLEVDQVLSLEELATLGEFATRQTRGRAATGGPMIANGGSAPAPDSPSLAAE